MSAVLEQVGIDGKEHPVAFASKTCNKVEAKYSSTDGELLALYYGITKFHSYLAGSIFTVVTDHQALLYMESAKGHNNRLARCALKLADYDFKLRYRQGVKHGNADGLTRAPATPNPTANNLLDVSFSSPLSEATTLSATELAALEEWDETEFLLAASSPDPPPTPQPIHQGPR